MKTREPNPISIALPSGVRIGILRGNLFTKHVWRSRHLYRSIGVHGSWGLDYEVLFHRLPVAVVIEVHEREEGIIYRTTGENFRANGNVLHFKEGTKDHYTQVFLPVERWDKVHIGGNRPTTKQEQAEKEADDLFNSL